MTGNSMHWVRTRWLTAALLAATVALGTGCQSSSDGESRTVGQVTDDVAIQTAIVSRFLADPQVAGLKIRTEVYRNVVTLYGSVPDESTRALALRIARDVKGVNRVEDRLTIVP